MQKSRLLFVLFLAIAPLMAPAQYAPAAAQAASQAASPPALPATINGFWLGELHAGGATLRVQITVKSDADGKASCTLDSLDQNAIGLPCDHVELKGDSFSFDVPVVHGHWAGKVSADGKSLAGSWDQGSALELNFIHQAAALAAKQVPSPVYDPAMPPVTAAELKAVMDRDLAKALESGQLAPSTGAGVSIGVIEHGVRRVFCYGTAKPESIFEIGSMSKTFTGIILAQMVKQGKVSLDEPVRELLPAGTVTKPTGPEITLLDLATQHSGLPRMPDNFNPADGANPYADYHAANLYAFISKHGVDVPAGASFLYSNLGFGLLGQALAVRARLTYPQLLRSEITGPLGLADTTVALSPEQKARFLPGHDGDHRPAHAWDLDALAGAGAIRSTAGDMLSYLAANLHPEAVKAAGSSGGNSSGATNPGTTSPRATLNEALEFSHQLRADAMPGMRIALAWLYQSDTGNYWHNGATGGYSSYGFFNPVGDYAAVVLLNTSIGAKGSFADRLGEHIAERLAGKPAISLAD